MKQLDLLEAAQDRAPEPIPEIEDDEDFSAAEEKEPHIFSVSELNGSIKSQLEGEFPLLWVQGEISNFKAHSSGHFYFSLKDDKSQINCVMFRGFNSRLKFRPESGQEVLIRGKVTVYEPRGNYQVFCEVMEPVGAGALQMAFEQLKKKLQAEGLFAQERKRTLPALPRHVALVTSPTGAAVRDMLNVLGRRFKGLNIIIVPVLVQGDRAAASIVEGLVKANRIPNLDVIICGRGGGSIEDLWCFNEEVVARAIAQSHVPVISAVGHEVDFTIADFVADLRAPTPSAAAELVVKNAQDLIDRVDHFYKLLRKSMSYQLQTLNQKVTHLERRLEDPQRKLQDLMIRCDELTQRLEQSIWRFLQDGRRKVELAIRKVGSPEQQLRMRRQSIEFLFAQIKSFVTKKLERSRAQLSQNTALLDSLSPLKVLDRGYSIAKAKGEVIRSVKQVTQGEQINVQIADGALTAQVLSVSNKEQEK